MIFRTTVTTTTYHDVDLHALAFKDWPEQAKAYAYKMPTSRVKQLATLTLEERKSYVINFVERRAEIDLLTLDDLL